MARCRMLDILGERLNGAAGGAWWGTAKFFWIWVAEVGYANVFR